MSTKRRAASSENDSPPPLPHVIRSATPSAPQDLSTEAMQDSWKARRSSAVQEVPTRSHELRSKKVKKELKEDYLAVYTRILRVEKGTWRGEKAQFIVVEFDHESDKGNPVKRAKIQIQVKSVPAAVPQTPRPHDSDTPGLAQGIASAEDGTSTIPEKMEGLLGLERIPPLRIVQLGPSRIGDYAFDDKAEEGPLVSTEQDTKQVQVPARAATFGTFLSNRDSFHLSASLGTSSSPGTENTSSLEVEVVANGIYYSPPAIQVAFVVLSNGQPFTLHAAGDYKTRGGPERRLTLIEPRQPAKFSWEGGELIPAGRPSMNGDFAASDMQRHYATAVDWPWEYGKEFPIIPAISEPTRPPTMSLSGHSSEDPTVPEQLDWSPEGVEQSLKPRSVSAEPGWDFEGTIVDESAIRAWLADEQPSDHVEGDLRRSGSTSTRTSSSSQSDKRAASHLGRFEYKGEAHTPPGGDPKAQLVLKKGTLKGLTIVTEITRVKTGTYDGRSAVYVGMKVDFIPGPSFPPQVETALIYVTVQKTSIAPGVQEPTRWNPFRRSEQARKVLDPSADVAIDVPTPEPGLTATPGAGGTSPPDPEGPHRPHIPEFVAYRPEGMLGAPVSDRVTPQRTISVGIAADVPAIGSINANYGNQNSHEHVMQQHSFVRAMSAPLGHRWREQQLPLGLAGVRNTLRVNATKNPYHQIGFQEVVFGAVVETYGKPFILTADVYCSCQGGIYHALPFTHRYPAQIVHGYSRGPAIDLPDFAHESMPWNVLVPPLDGYTHLPGRATA